jgi:hypothetical protein
VLKNTVDIGNYLEKKESVRFQKSYLPILVSSKLLRRRSMGQIDLCRLNGNIIEIGEVKSSGSLSIKQKERLFASSSFLSDIFNRNSKLILIHAVH